MSPRHFQQATIWLILGLAVGGVVGLVAMQGWLKGLSILGLTFVGLAVGSWLSEDEKVRRQ